jgi:dienelactone hydrolase
MWRQLLVAVAVAWSAPILADEAVQFEAARYQIGPLQQRFAQERGQTIERPPPQKLTGYLSKPAGAGPFAAIVYLHGCLGLENFRREQAAAQLTGWGYVSLVVDSFATRGISEDCAAPFPERQPDALGALRYLASLPFVDPQRIALIGVAQGGTSALQIATARRFEIFEMPRDLQFKAVVAFYPSCGAAGSELAIPALVLTGGIENWGRAVDCEYWMQRRHGRGAPVQIEVYPEAYYAFDNPSLKIARRMSSGRWIKYDPDATAKAHIAMRDFLAAQLK